MALTIDDFDTEGPITYRETMYIFALMGIAEDPAVAFEATGLLLASRLKDSSRVEEVENMHLVPMIGVRDQLLEALADQLEAINAVRDAERLLGEADADAD